MLKFNLKVIGADFYQVVVTAPNGSQVIYDCDLDTNPAIATNFMTYAPFRIMDPSGQLHDPDDMEEEMGVYNMLLNHDLQEIHEQAHARWHALMTLLPLKTFE